MIRVIGMGPGNIKYLTLDAIEKIKSCNRVIAFGRIGRTAEEFRSDVIKVSRVDEIIENIEKDMDTGILASGDPCFYGVLEYLVKKGINIDEVIPGLSSFQYITCKLKKSWQNAALISLHGRDGELERVCSSKLSIILTDSKNTPDKISRELYNMGVRGIIYAGFNLSYEDEFIDIKKIGEEIEIKSSLAVMVVENEMD